MKFRLNRPSLQLTFHSLRVLLGRSILDCCTRLSSTHNRLQNNSCRNFTLKQQRQQLFGQLHSWKWKCVSKTIYLTRSFDGWTNALRPVDSQIKFLLSLLSLSLSLSSVFDKFVFYSQILSRRFSFGNLFEEKEELWPRCSNIYYYQCDHIGLFIGLWATF